MRSAGTGATFNEVAVDTANAVRVVLQISATFATASANGPKLLFTLCYAVIQERSASCASSVSAYEVVYLFRYAHTHAHSSPAGAQHAMQRCTRRSPTVADI